MQTVWGAARCACTAGRVTSARTGGLCLEATAWQKSKFQSGEPGENELRMRKVIVTVARHGFGSCLGRARPRRELMHWFCGLVYVGVLVSCLPSACCLSGTWVFTSNRIAIMFILCYFDYIFIFQRPIIVQSKSTKFDIFPISVVCLRTLFCWTCPSFNARSI